MRPRKPLPDLPSPPPLPDELSPVDIPTPQTVEEYKKVVNKSIARGVALASNAKEMAAMIEQAVAWFKVAYADESKEGQWGSGLPALTNGAKHG